MFLHSRSGWFSYWNVKGCSMKTLGLTLTTPLLSQEKRNSDTDGATTRTRNASQIFFYLLGCHECNDLGYQAAPAPLSCSKHFLMQILSDANKVTEEKWILWSDINPIDFFSFVRLVSYIAILKLSQVQLSCRWIFFLLHIFVHVTARHTLKVISWNLYEQ